MSLIIDDKYRGSTVSYRRGTAMVCIRKLEDATPEQLKELAEMGHPGVVKYTKASQKASKKGSSSS